jgi:inosine/xanthosine triphosphatase
MHVGVGSLNPVKRGAVERVVPAGWTVEAVDVPSGVAEQPIGHAETVAGADHRARSTLDAGDYDLGVGIEGGVVRREGLDGRWLVVWATVADGERLARATGPSLRLPDRIAARIDAGEELGPVMDDELGERAVARGRGAAGALTGGATDRETALAGAVAGALGPFVTDHYDPR